MCCETDFNTTVFDPNVSHRIVMFVHWHPLKMTKSALTCRADFQIHILSKAYQTAAGNRSIGIAVPPSILMAGRSTL